MDKQFILPMIAAAVIAAAATRYLSRNEVAAAAVALPPDQSSTTLAALRSEVGALRQELRANALAVSALQAARADLVNAPAASAEVAPPEQREPAARESHDLNSPERAAWAANRKAALASREANFQTEGRNGVWASEKTSSLRERANSLGALSDKLRAIDCRSKTCRVEIDDDQATSDELHRFVRECGRDFPKIVADHIKEPQGRASYVFYMTDA